MNTQPKALRLADELTKPLALRRQFLPESAAAELRRLHDLLGKANALNRIRAETNRELLEALISLMYWDNGRSEFDRARQVIIKVKGGAA